MDPKIFAQKCTEIQRKLIAIHKEINCTPAWIVVMVDTFQQMIAGQDDPALTYLEICKKLGEYEKKEEKK